MTELEKIMDEYANPKNVAMSSIWIIGNLKGINLKVLELNDTIAQFFVIGSATNSTQTRSMADHILKHLKNNQIKVNSVEGMTEANWILIDTGEVVIHIFQEGIRELYNLEEIWGHAGTVQIPDSYYISTLPLEEVDNFKKYF